MKPRTLTIPVVLMLLALAVLPGICFSYNLSSSVTSYNNIITTPSSDSPITLPSDSDFNVKAPVDKDGKPSYEITLKDRDTFVGTGKKDPKEETAVFNIQAGTVFVIYMKVGGTGNSSSFKVTVSQGSTYFFNGCPFSSNKSGGTSGYANVSEGNQGIFVGFDQAMRIESDSVLPFNITVVGSSSGADIHFSIVVISTQSGSGS